MANEPSVAAGRSRMPHSISGGRNARGLDVSDVKKLRQLKDKNRRLKQMVAEQALALLALKAGTAKNW